MAEWLVEQGIAEDRAVQVENGRIIASRIHWAGELIAGQVTEGKLVSRNPGAARGTAELAGGQHILVDRLPKSTAEGAMLRLEIIRSAISERGRLKMAQARPSAAPLNQLDLAASIQQDGGTVRLVHRFAEGDWDDLLADALAGEVHFDGGALLLAPTPAMIVIDIDGNLPARQLALAAAKPLADTLRRLDIGGMIGIDFPTIENRADRKDIDDSLAAVLDGWPHERTAMNGFGFVQLVSRLQRPSLAHRANYARGGLLVGQLLRRAERIEEPGAIELRLHPALQQKIKPEWQTELARRTGREVRIEADPELALEGAFAQAVPL